MRTIVGISQMAYNIRLEHDGTMYHFTICRGWTVVHHFVAEFDTETEAREWASELVGDYLEQIENGTI